MNKNLTVLENFIIDQAAKGHIQIGEYLKLIDNIYNLDKVCSE